MENNNSQQPHDYQDVVDANSAVESSGSSTSSSSSSPTGFSYNDQPHGFQQVSDNPQGSFGNYQAGAQNFDQHGYRFDCPWNGTSNVHQTAYNQPYETYSHPTISQSQYSGNSSSQGSPWNGTSNVHQTAYNQPYETYSHPTISQSQYSGNSSSQSSPQQSQYGAYPTHLEKRYERSSLDSITDMDQSGRTACKNKRGPKSPKLPEMKDLEWELKKETATNNRLKGVLRTKTEEKDALLSEVISFFN